jgi:hypothetical protein
MATADNFIFGANAGDPTATSRVAQVGEYLGLYKRPVIQINHVVPAADEGFDGHDLNAIVWTQQTVTPRPYTRRNDVVENIIPLTVDQRTLLEGAKEIFDKKWIVVNTWLDYTGSPDEQRKKYARFFAKMSECISSRGDIVFKTSSDGRWQYKNSKTGLARTIYDIQDPMNERLPNDYVAPFSFEHGGAAVPVFLSGEHAYSDRAFEANFDTTRYQTGE